MGVPLNIDWQQILLHLLNFVILAGGLYLLLYQPVKAFMEKRQSFYREQDAQAAKLLADAKQAAAEAQRKMKDADAAAAEKMAAGKTCSYDMSSQPLLFTCYLSRPARRRIISAF